MDVGKVGTIEKKQLRCVLYLGLDGEETGTHKCLEKEG